MELDQDNLAALTEDSSLVEQVEARHMVEVLVQIESRQSPKIRTVQTTSTEEKAKPNGISDLVKS